MSFCTKIAAFIEDHAMVATHFKVISRLKKLHKTREILGPQDEVPAMISQEEFYRCNGISISLKW